MYGKTLYRWVVLAFSLLGPGAFAAVYASPAGERPAITRPGAASILPGGRLLAPIGRSIVTGPGTFGIAISPNGKTIVTSNLGSERQSLTVIEPQKAAWTVRNLVLDSAEAAKAGLEGARDDAHWRGIFMGLAFSGEKSIYTSEGESGRVSLVDLSSGNRRKILDLNQNGLSGSFTADLAEDLERSVLYVLDQANFRLVAIDTRKGRILSSMAVGRMPSGIALSPNRRRVYVAADDPNAGKSDSLTVVNVDDSSAPRIEAILRTGTALSGDGGSAPSGMLAAAGRVFVSNPRNDTVTVIDAANNTITREIPIRIPGLDRLRGVLPLGLAYDEADGWLLVAEAGINAVGVIDVKLMQVIGHIPADWFPARLAIRDGMVYVANARGHGTGPNLPGRVSLPDAPELSGILRRGTVTAFALPTIAELPKLTGTVFAANGFFPINEPAPAKTPVKHVVLIVKENRSFDEVFGDLRKASNGVVVSAPPLARFGHAGYADGEMKRLSLQGVNVTPNHHEIASRWAFSDNFYAASEGGVDGHHWLTGSYQAGGGTIWHHFERHGIGFRNFGEGLELAGPLYRNTSREYPGFNMNIPDQSRANQFIREIDQKYVKGGEPFPQFVFIHLPNDHMAKARPEDGYPYAASFVADNDYALGRIVEYLSHSPWWREMAIFVTGDNAQEGYDHIDSHRTVLLGIGPYFRKNYVSHRNTSFPGLLKTIFGMLGLPPLNLFDACASDLSDSFTQEPDFTPYMVKPVDKRLFDPATAREPLRAQ